MQATKHVGLSAPARSSTLAAGAGAEHELHVERLEAVGDLGLVIDDEHFVFGRQALGQGKADLAAADDEDAHAPTDCRRAASAAP